MLKIKTEALQVATAKAVKGMGNLSILAITSSMGITVKDGDLTLSTTTNAMNLDVIVKDVADKAVSMYVCTDGNLFGKLVAKTTTDFIELEQTENSLRFTGDGVYNLPLIQDEEGNMARITDIKVESNESYTVSAQDLKKLLTYNKLAVSKSYDQPIYTGYCVKDNHIYTFNDVTACISSVDLKNISALLPAPMVDLFNLFEDKTVTVSIQGNSIKFSSADVTITGALLEGLSYYPADAIAQLANSADFKNTVKISKPKLSAALDRLSLFIDKTDKNKITVTFSENNLIITNNASSAGEQLDYTEKSITESKIYPVDLQDLKGVVDASPVDVITILFGHDNGICIEDGNMRYIVPMLDEE